MKNMEEIVRDFVSTVIKYYTSEIDHKEFGRGNIWRSNRWDSLELTKDSKLHLRSSKNLKQDK